MMFDDDEEIVLQTVPESSSFQTKRTDTTVWNKTEAPLEETKFKVMLELTGVAESDEDRLGVDLVTVLDISRSMKNDEKLEKLKSAMKFLIKKLSPIDRLSVVTFSDQSNRVCELRLINETSKAEIERQVMNLATRGHILGLKSTNIQAGLRMALKVLNGRQFKRNRSAAIMLMSDGDQKSGDASPVDVSNVPVYTFGFGNDYKPDVLNTIANDSAGGTFSVVQDLNKLNEAFSQCLAGLLSVVVQDLKVTFTQKNSTNIEKVSAGKYFQPEEVDSNGVEPVTVSFGVLYEKEVRKVIVDLLLPAVPSPQDGVDILEITHSYSPEGEAKPIIVSVSRVRNSNEPEREELETEEMRNETARSIKEARQKADNKRLDEAKEKIKAAIKFLFDRYANPGMVIMSLKLELEQLLELMKDQATYEKQGRAFALASETSHALQRFASRGDVRAFATELMNAYLEQAQSFDKDPTKPLPPDPIRRPPTTPRSIDPKNVTLPLPPDPTKPLPPDPTKDPTKPLPPDPIRRPPTPSLPTTSRSIDPRKFDDDEEIIAGPENFSESESSETKRTKVKVVNKTEAPLGQTEFKVLLEINGVDPGEKRLGVDLVTVLDISGSMEEDGKLEKLKIALQFLIKKLSPIDRLSVVTFSNRPNRLCPLRQIHENSQVDIENLVKNLDAGGGTNISAGLEMGLQVLNGRRFTRKRSTAIMLMSDGNQGERYKDAAKVELGNVPVYTFGFGTDYNPETLNAIANNSAGGTFSFVEDLNKLSEAFSQCLAGLLSVVVQDLKVTFTPDNSMIEKVSAGNYPQSKDAGSVTISFGDLYEKELRKVIVYLLLPAVIGPQDGIDILEITHSYSPEGEARPIIASVSRVPNSNEPEREELKTEEMRNETAQSIKAAREKADNKQLDEAKEKLRAAQRLLNDVFDKPNEVIELLKSELQQLLDLMATQDLYNRKGRAFALSSETSHALQRFASRGDVRAFATELMNAYLEQAQSFDKDPTKPLPPDPIRRPSSPPTTPRPIDPENVNLLTRFFEYLKGNLQ